MKIELEGVPDEVIEQALREAEKAATEVIESKLGRRVADLVVVVSFDSSEKLFAVDVEVRGFLRGRYDYKDIVEEAINAAAKAFVRYINEVRKRSG